MPIPWTTLPREPFVAQAVALFDERDSGGVAVLGVDGVGKTTLATQIAGRLGQRNPVRVVGTGTQTEVPFGAFGPLVRVTEIGKPAALIHAVAGMARALGMKVVAEGVETEVQKKFLKIAGVHSLQGYLFGKPAPVDVLREEWSAQPMRMTG